MSQGPAGLEPDSSSDAPAGARETARARALELRAQHRKQDRRRRFIVTGSIVLATVLVLAVVAAVLVSMARPTARGPLNMISDGIKIGADFKAQPTAALQPGEKPVASKPNKAGVLDIKLYVDYLCQDCGAFQKTNGAQLRAWVKSGAATVEIHPIAVLTTKSASTQYSLRAANAAACVAELSPNRFFAFNDALFARQPKEGSTGLSDDQLLSRAASAKVTHLGSLKRCIAEQRFKSWVQSATSRALNGPIPDADIPAIAVTPTILVDGQQFMYTSDFDPDEFAQFVVQVSGDAFTENPTPTPTPSPTPAP